MAEIESVKVNDVSQKVEEIKPEPEKPLTLEEATAKLKIYDNNFNEIARFINVVSKRLAVLEEQQNNIVEFLAQDKKDTVKERLVTKSKTPL